MQSVCDVHVTKGFNPEAPCAASPALLWLGGTISILLPTAVFLKVPSNFCRNLIISHLVHCFNADDASTKFISLETFLQLTLGLTGAKSQNRYYITNTPDYHLVVNVEIPVNVFRRLSSAGTGRDS